MVREKISVLTLSFVDGQKRDQPLIIDKELFKIEERRLFEVIAARSETAGTDR